MANERYLLQGRDAGVLPGPKYVSWWAKLPTDPYTGGYVPVGPIVDVAILRDLGPPVGPRTLLDLNFASLANTPLATDTTYSIAGKTWSKYNSANDASAMNITNGQGLVMTPNSASNYFTVGTFNLPGLAIPLSSLDPYAPILGTHLRLWFYYFSENPNANYDYSWGGITMGNSNAVAYTYGRSAVGANGSIFTRMMSLSGMFQIGRSSLTLSTVPVCCIDIPQIGYPQIGMGFGAYTGGDFPAFKDLSVLIGGTTAYDFGAYNPTTASLWMGAMRSGSGTAFVSKVGRVKVEMWD